MGNLRLYGSTSGYVEIAPPAVAGTSSLILPTGTTDLSASWTSYTPTVTAAGGTFTSVSASGKYAQIGKIVFCSFTVNITTNGTAFGAILVTTPVTKKSTSSAIGAGREGNSTGYMAQVTFASDTQFFVQKYDGTYLGANGYGITASIVYEAA